MSRILIANELPVCEEIKKLAFRRLRNLFHWRRRRRNLPTIDGSGAAVNEQAYRDLLARQGFPMPIPFNSIMREIVRNQARDLIPIARMPEGSVCIARNSSDRPLHINDRLVAGENGGVRPIEPEELEAMIRDGNQTIVACLEEVNDTPFVRVRVLLGNLNVITGEPYRSVGEAINQLGEVMQPILNTVVEAVQPLAEMVERVVDDIAEGCAIPRETLIGARLPPRPSIVPNKYDTKYPHICFQCKRPLQYEHALGKAFDQGFTVEQHKKMWKSAVVEYYCCNCYDRKKRTINVISTPHPDAGLFSYDMIRRSMGYANRRWGGGYPQLHLDPAGNAGHRSLRLVNEAGEILYQEEPLNIDPVIIHEEPVHHETIGLNVILNGGFNDDGERQYCHHSASRIVNTPLPEDYREVSIAMEFPEVVDSNKLITIAQIYTKWMMLTREIRIGNLEFPAIVRNAIQSVIRSDAIHALTTMSFLELFGRDLEEYFVLQDSIAIAEHQERVIWRGYDIRRINRVHLHGGVLEGDRLEAIAENPERQQENGVHTFVESHPEIINQERLNELANTILERECNREYPVERNQWQNEYEQNPFVPEIADCPHHEFNERGECLACGIHSVQLDEMRSRRLAEHHRRGQHSFEIPDIHGGMICSVCRLTPMEIDAQRNRNNIYNHLALSRNAERRC